jgi:hypothetical protein
VETGEGVEVETNNLEGSDEKFFGSGTSTADTLVRSQEPEGKSNG